MSSTNDRARELALAGASHGALVTADEQTAGRGRQGRSWIAPPRRALLLSLVVRSPAPLLPLAAAVAVAELAGDAAAIKWPNDVLLGAGAKLAGILVEGRPQEGWAVLGMGVNVAVRPSDLPAELRCRAASLGREPGELEHVLDDLLARLERWLSREPAPVLEAWRARDALRGRCVRWNQHEGTAVGVDDDGRLLVRLANGQTLALSAGEVHLASTRGRPASCYSSTE